MRELKISLITFINIKIIKIKIAFAVHLFNVQYLNYHEPCQPFFPPYLASIEEGLEDMSLENL